MQHSFIFSLALLGLVSLSTPSWGSQPVTRNEVTKSKIVEEGGTGPYKAVMQELYLSGAMALAPIPHGNISSSSMRLHRTVIWSSLRAISLKKRSLIEDPCQRPSSRHNPSTGPSHRIAIRIVPSIRRWMSMPSAHRVCHVEVCRRFTTAPTPALHC